MVLLVPIALLAGVVTALTPCVLPVLPILLAGGGSGGRRRPYAIVAGLVTTFSVFVLAGAWVLARLHLGAQWQTRIAVVAMLVLAATLVVPRVAVLLERPFLFLTRRRAGDLGGGFLLGASLGLVFVPCGGPVFGAVSSVVGLHRVGGWIVALTIAYAVGAALPMLAIARGGAAVAGRFRANAHAFRVAAGVVIAVGAIAISQGWETSLQTRVPGYAKSIQSAIEGNAYAKRHLARLQGVRVREEVGGLRNYGPARDFRGIADWLNTPRDRPLTLASLHGKVVLIDFWTYSCINCLRTLPHLEAWYRRYHAHGLEIVGVHTPEFPFEHVLANVAANVKRLGVRYPVALDNRYATWNAYANEYWPAEYLVDRSGHLRHVHFGEGEYGETERLIQQLLGERGPVTHVADRTPNELLTPETYLGVARLANYEGDTPRVNRYARYRLPLHLDDDSIAYGGVWRVGGDRIVAGRGATIRFHYRARDVYLVAGGRGRITSSVDGRPARTVVVRGARLYTVVGGTQYRNAVLELHFTRGISAYSFTFG